MPPSVRRGRARRTARPRPTGSRPRSASPTSWPGGQCGDDRVVVGITRPSRRRRANPTSSKNSTFGLVVRPLLGEVVFVVDRLHRAHRLAGAAVHALVRVDVQRPFALVDAVDGALVDARAVLHVHTRQGEYVYVTMPVFVSGRRRMRVRQRATAMATRIRTEIAQTMPDGESGTITDRRVRGRRRAGSPPW